jgi:hypothetical protein
MLRRSFFHKGLPLSRIGRDLDFGIAGAITAHKDAGRRSSDHRPAIENENPYQNQI